MASVREIVRSVIPVMVAHVRMIVLLNRTVAQVPIIKKIVVILEKNVVMGLVVTPTIASPV